MDTSHKTNQQTAVDEPVSQVLQTPSQPVIPVGSGAKEHGVVAASETAPFLTPSEAEPVLHPELEAAGVEVVQSERPQLPQDVKQMGVELAKDSVPVSTQPSGIVQLPMTKQQALQTLQQNKKNPKLSVDWLALFVLKLLKKQEKSQGVGAGK